MNNFYKRTNEACDKNKSNDFIGFIDNVINLFPNLKIKENSLLYKAAINQYNTESIKLPTIDRISIPSWFCGYIDPNTGLLYTSNEEIIQTNSLLLQQNLAANILSGIPNSAYPIDKCLSATASQPGNLSYSNCEVIVLSDVYLSRIEWSTAFYPTETIEEGIQQIEQTVANNMNAFAASYGVSNVHKNLTEEECNGLVGLYGGTCELKKNGKYEFDSRRGGISDEQEECVARYYRIEVTQGKTPIYHDPFTCKTPDIGGALGGTANWSVVKSGSGLISNVKIINGGKGISWTESSNFRAKWRVKDTINAKLYGSVSSGSAELEGVHTNQSQSATVLTNLFPAPGRFEQPLNSGDVITMWLADINGGNKTNTWTIKIEY